MEEKNIEKLPSNPIEAQGMLIKAFMKSSEKKLYL